MNQRLPSGPEVIAPGLAFAVGIAYSVTLPVVEEILPIKFPEVPVDSEKIVNQRLPSGPVVMLFTPPFATGTM